ncbi:MAG: AmmeMemoRadiSam system protein A [bacterium]|nr:AmmeMemoRadiSam system protein A [bacterium]
MGILAAYAVPHPPLIIPDCGCGKELEIQSTVDAFEEIAIRVALEDPDTIVVSSPHAPYYGDSFFIDCGERFVADFRSFGAPDDKVDVQCDREMADAIIARAASATPAIRMKSSQGFRPRLDHGTFIPLWFIDRAFAELGIEKPRYKLVRLGLSTLPCKMNRELGKIIADIAGEQGKKAIFIASGDLSHKLLADGPYGISKAGLEFEERIQQILDSADFDALFDFTDEFRDAAAECGLGSFQMMAGALERTAETQGYTIAPKLLSHEGPFGVGYGVASYTLVDPCVELARKTVEAFANTGAPIERPVDLPHWMLEKSAATFVSLHIGDTLRGCIGTLSPARECIADEIIGNAVWACSEDRRFMPVEPDELDYIAYSVDVLEEPEHIDSPDQLDVKVYGVIVTKGNRRGVLLPDLEGVDTVEQQIAIAKRKAGIISFEKDVELQRFKVVRHTLGGQARVV